MSECRNDFEGRAGTLRLSRRGLLQSALGAGVGLGFAQGLKLTAEDRLDLRPRRRRISNLASCRRSTVICLLTRRRGRSRPTVSRAWCATSLLPTSASTRWNRTGPRRKVVSTLERAGVEIVSLFGYYNIVDRDAQRRKLGEARIEALLSNVNRLGCRVVSTETGTFNSHSEWESDPENQTEQGYLQCKAVFEKHARLAEKHGAMLAIEGYYRNIIGTIDRAERLFREVHSPALRLVMDPCNYYRKDDLPRMKPMLEAMFQKLGDQIVIAHAKDVRPSGESEELPAAGLGVLDYPLFLRLLAQLDRPIPLMVEHLRRPDVERAKGFVLGQIDRI